jgi:alanyl-tRNA synthetase
MTSSEIRDKFLNFFKARGHKITPSSSLIPKDDPSVLFTTAGMQQFKPYYTGQKDPLADFGSLNTVSCQRCVRTSDIEEVGDESHLTFFEMLGNFSFGGYFKEDAIKYAWEFLTEVLGIEKPRIHATYFKGEKGIAEDKESLGVLKKIKGLNEIKPQGFEDNFWSLWTENSPAGPTVEFYVDGIEIWNIVFNEYFFKNGKYELSNTKGVDTGMGLERLAMMMQGAGNIFETDLFQPIMEILEKAEDARAKRIIADHLRASAYIIDDGILPSNVGRGYVLRRLLRRVVKYEKTLNLNPDFYGKILEILGKNGEILKVVMDERVKFSKTLEQGLKQFEKISDNVISGKDAFMLFSTYGFPFEMTEELAREKGISVDRKGFEEEFKKHQEVSRVGADKKFKGGLGGTGVQETRLHTATHLLHQALREVLGRHVVQKGSNITAERLRFDFSHSQKMTPEEIKKVEDLVNQKIADDLPVTCEEMGVKEAKEKGALGVFEDKYEDKIKVYSIGEFSREICGGPHVKSTGELGVFKIKKEEASSAGVRRIKAVLK